MTPATDGVYLDTAILVKLVVPESDSPYDADLVEGQIVSSSQLVMSECFSARPAILRLSVNEGRWPGAVRLLFPSLLYPPVSTIARKRSG